MRSFCSIVETMSASMESLDDNSDVPEIENDPDLSGISNEPEAWSVTVDKKVSLRACYKSFPQSLRLNNMKLLYLSDFEEAQCQRYQTARSHLG